MVIMILHIDRVFPKFQALTYIVCFSPYNCLRGRYILKMKKWSLEKLSNLPKPSLLVNVDLRELNPNFSDSKV